MTAWWRWLVIGSLLSLVAALPARPQEGEQRPERLPRAREIPTEGFWPTRTMMERAIDRMTEDLAERYGFDEEQLRLTRELFKDRFPTFLSENRAEIQTLMNQYFEAILNDEPPAVEDVAEWAARVQPLLAEFGGVVEEVAEAMREYLTEEQQLTLDGELVAFQTGMKMIQNRLSVWAAGGYDPETEWIRPGPERRQRRREERQRAREAMDQARREATGQDRTSPPGAASQPAARPDRDEWTRYTEAFIARYQLNAEQRQKAYMFLHRQQEERDRYLRRKADEIQRVTELLRQAEVPDERQAALDAYARLNAPVERMFQQLKDRLNTLPTRAQRRAAAAAGLEDESPRRRAAPRSQPATATSADDAHR